MGFFGFFGWVFHCQPCLETLEVVGLGFARLAGTGPEGEAGGRVRGRDPFISVRPEPAVHVDGLQVLRITTLIQ